MCLHIRCLQVGAAPRAALAVSLRSQPPTAYRQYLKWVGSSIPARPLGRPRMVSPSHFTEPRFSSLRPARSPILHTRDSILSYVNISWRRGRDWLRFAPGLRPDPADRLFAHAGSPNLSSHPFGRATVFPAANRQPLTASVKYPGGGEGIRTPGTLRFI